MATLDGMDPQLVRQLLAEVRGAAELMRTTESKITGLMSRAGVPAQVTHRPSQVADSCDAMARDVSARLALLEKEEKQKTPAPETPKADTPKSDQPESSRPEDAPTSEGDPKGEEKAPKGTGEPDGPKGKDEPKGEDEPEKSAPREKPDAPQEKPDAKREGPSGKDAPEQPTDPPKADKEDAPRSDREDAPKREEEDAPRADKDADSRSECEERDRGRVDTPEKDHPDDTGTSDVGRPRIIDVDGVKVVQVPLDPPTAEELRDLLESLERAQPMDMPTVTVPERDATPAPDGSNGRFDGASPTPSAPGDPEYGTERIVQPQPGDSCATLPPADGDDRSATGDDSTRPPAMGGDGRSDDRSPQPSPTADPDVIAPTPPPGMEADTAPPSAEGDGRQPTRPSDVEGERRPPVTGAGDTRDVQPPSADARTPAEPPATEGDRRPGPVDACPAPSGAGESDQPRDTGGARDGGDPVRPSQPEQPAQPQPRPLPFGEVGLPGPQSGADGSTDVRGFITLLNGEDAVTMHGEAGRDHSPPDS